MTQSDTAEPRALPFLDAWDNWATACQTVLERLSGATAAELGGPTPLAFLGSLKDFAANLGVPAHAATGEHFKPDQMFASFLPALGYSREYQEIARRMLELTLHFQRRCADLAQQGIDVGQSALQDIQRSLQDRTMDGSPAAIYDAWIDRAEEAYARVAHGEAFARMLADICNTLSALKIERGKMIEALARHLDWPSRAEVDSLHRQVRSLTATLAKSAAPATAGSVDAATRSAKTNDVSKTLSRGKKTTAKAARAGKPKARKRAGK